MIYFLIPNTKIQKFVKKSIALELLPET